jgi:hypothetical protein
MRSAALALLIAFTAAPALAQDGRFVDPQPVDFDRPFQFDGMKARFAPGAGASGLRNEDGTTQGIPIEDWLANGRKVEGLAVRREPKTEIDVRDATMLRELFKDFLPVETPVEPAPPARR